MKVLTNKKRLAAIAAGLFSFSSVMAEDVTLNWALWNFNSEPYYQAIIDAYEAKNPGIKIEYTDLGANEYSQMLSTQLSGGSSGIDVLSVKDVPQYASMISKNNMVNLNSLVESENIDLTAYSGLADEITVDGNLYALPYRSDFWLVYYNKDLFDAAGIDYPTNDMTFDEFDKLSVKLSSGFGSKKIYGSIFHTWRSTVQIAGILDGKNTLADGNYDFLESAYKRALKLQDKKIVPTYGFLKTTKTHYSGPFYNGQLAMLPMGSWFIGSQISKVESGESDARNWGLVKYPHPKGTAAGTTASTITSIAINAKSKNQEAAKDFVQFVAGSEGAEIIAQAGTIPALRSDTVLKILTSKKGFPTDENSLEAMETVQTYLEMPVTLKAAQIELVLNRAHDAIMTENISIKDGIREMNEGVQAVLN